MKLKPQLATQYEKATLKVFGVGARVGKSQYERFEDAEKALRRSNIYPRDYAYGIMVYLKDWVQRKNWIRMSIYAFCGPWARDVYRKEIQSIEFVETTEKNVDHGILLYDELLAARYYIDSAGSMTFREVVGELEPALSPGWLDAYKNNKRAKIVVKALEVLSMRAGKPIDDYNELIQ